MMATSEAGGTSDRNVRLKYRSEGVTLSDVASMIVNMGFKPCSEFHTLMPMSVPKNCIAQFVSPAIKREFVRKAESNTDALEVFRVFRPQTVIICNRVPMEMGVEKLEDLLFPPRIRPKLKIVRRHVELNSVKTRMASLCATLEECSQSEKKCLFVQLIARNLQIIRRNENWTCT